MNAERKREFVGTVLITTMLAALYGIIHDQITVRISAPYFTVWHPPVFGTDDPVLVALGWGVLATWWMGAGLGGLFGLAAAWNPMKPSMCPWRVLRRTAWVFAASAAAAALAGLLAVAVRFEAPSFVMGSAIARLGASERLAFSVCLAIHNTSYNAAFIASLVAARRIWLERNRRCSCGGRCSLQRSRRDGRDAPPD